MFCSKCGRWIEGDEIVFAREGIVGKPFCRRCRAEVEEEAREKYRRGLAKQQCFPNHYRLGVYRPESNEEN
jgi:hypothetical protein